MNSSRVLIVPIEVKVREFYSRLYFAAKAVRRGYTALLGRSTVLHGGPMSLRKFPKGIIVENDVTPQGYRFIAEARSRGYGIVAWDEEGIVTPADDLYAEYRVCERTLERVALFFTRGCGDASAIAARYPNLEARLRPAGNPRFDILRPAIFRHRAVLSPGRGNIILFNSRFAAVNPCSSASLEQRRRNRLAKYDLIGRDTAASRVIGRWFDYQKMAFQRCQELVAALAEAFPDKTVIVRPHPSENRKAWEAVAGGYRNCLVGEGGSAIESSLEADVLIHNNCTTAIEANLLGVPTISFLPNPDELPSNQLPNLIGPSCCTISSVIEAVRTTELGGAKEIEARSRAAREKYGAYIAGLGAKDSSDIMLDAIDGLRVNMEPLHWRLSVQANAWTTRLKHSVKETMGIGKLDPTRLAAKQAYYRRKFPGLSQEEISEVLARFGFGSHRVEPFADQWFCISA